MSNKNNKQLENTIVDVVDFGIEVAEVAEIATDGVVEAIVEGVVEVGQSAVEAIIGIIVD